LLELKQEDLETECQKNGFKIKLADSYEKKKYDKSKKEAFEPFRSKQK